MTSTLSRMAVLTSSVTSSLSYHAYTLFLFSKSDIMTTLIPVGLFALGTAPLSPTRRLAHAIQAIIWLWLHLLQFNLANQVRDPEEDIRNKPWRPLPSGRVSLKTTIILGRIATVICLIVSLFYSRGVFCASTFFAVLIPMYHELHGDQHWVSKNLMNTFGCVCFASGATMIAASDQSRIDSTGIFSVCVIAAIVATTIQAQDFQDVDGDKSVGRKTLPIVFPSFSRYTPILTLLFWSRCLTFIWEIGPTIGSFSFTALAIVVGVRYYVWRTAKSDKVSYFLYNIWLGIAFSMPGYWRMYKESATC